jgi:hypothetical protein
LANSTKNSSLVKKYRKPGTAFGIIVLILVILLASARYLIRNKVITYLNSTESISFEEVSVPWTFRSISLTGLEIKGDTTRQRFKGSRCSSVTISGIGWWAFIRHKNVEIDELKFSDGLLSFQPTGDTSTQYARTELPAIRINKADFEKVDFYYAFSAEKKLEAKGVSGEVKAINFNAAGDRDLLYEIKEVNIKEGKYEDLASAYDVRWDSISLDREQLLVFNELKLLPKFKKEDWAEQFQYKKSHLSLNIPQLKFYQLGIDTILQKQKIVADSVALLDARLEVFLEKEKPPCPYCDKKFIHQKFYQLNLPVNIPKVLLQNNSIAIEVKSEKTGKHGTITFNNIYASVYEVNNLRPHVIQADLRASFMKASPLRLQLKFDTNRPDFPYYLTGNLKNFDLQDLNTFFYLTKRTKVDSGFCNNLEWDFEGNQQTAKGNLKMDYKDLKITLYEKDEQDPKGLISGIINELGINNTNQPGNKNYREGVIYYEQPNNHGMFHQWWHALKSGIKSIVLPKILLDKELKTVT